jgi:hypothetical protein
VQRHCWQLLWFRNSAKALLAVVVQEKHKDVAAGSCGSGKVQRRCCWQLWFRNSVKMLLPAVVVQE